MKGSPLLATALACLIMLVMYVGMRASISDPEPLSNTAEDETHPHQASGETSVDVEIYFSSQPKSFTISDPITGQELIQVDNPEDAVWSGKLSIPIEKLTSTEIDIQCKAVWGFPAVGHHFMQMIISPDDLDSQSKTLRAEFDIVDVMTFHWKEEL